jgi:hypothetical protein
LKNNAAFFSLFLTDLKKYLPNIAMNIEGNEVEFSIPAVELLQQKVAHKESTDGEEGVDHDGSIEQNHGVDAAVELQTTMSLINWHCAC